MPWQRHLGCRQVYGTVSQVSPPATGCPQYTLLRTQAHRKALGSACGTAETFTCRPISQRDKRVNTQKKAAHQTKQL